MDWSSERYVRVYTRDTPEWICLAWQAKALWPLLLRKVDRAGVLATKLGVKGLAALVGLPLDVVEVGLRELLEDGCVTAHQLGYVVPNFIEAQEARMDGAERQRKHREARRDMVKAGLLPDERDPVVYFIQSEHGGPVKIGFAEDVAKRLVQLQVSRPDQLCLLASFPGAVSDEAELHRRFAHIRERGEWFTATEELMEVVRSYSRDQSQSVSSNGHDLRPVTPYRSDPSDPSVPIQPVVVRDKPAPKAKVDPDDPKPRAHTIPSDWSPRAKEREKAVEFGLECDSEAEHFRDHHTSKGTKFINWDAAFSTWLRNAKKWSRSSRANQAGISSTLLEWAREDK